MPLACCGPQGSDEIGQGEFQDLGIVYIGLSLGDQIDVISTLTRFCIMVSIAVVLLGGSLGALVVQRTLSPLKRIEDRREDCRRRSFPTCAGKR